MVIYFIRHGQSENNALWDRTGNSIGRSEDPVLSDIGKKQAEQTAAYVAEKNERFPYDEQKPFGITHIYASPMVRALETGTIISEKLGIALCCKKEYHETGGIFQDIRNNKGQGEITDREGLPGKTWGQLQELFPKADFCGADKNEPWWNRPFEHADNYQIRAKRVLNDILATHSGTDHRIAIITHGGIYSHIIGELLGKPEDRDIWFSMCNCGISRIDEKEDKFAISYCNYIEHLDEDLFT